MRFHKPLRRLKTVNWILYQILYMSIRKKFLRRIGRWISKSRPAWWTRPPNLCENYQHVTIFKKANLSPSSQPGLTQLTATDFNNSNQISSSSRIVKVTLIWSRRSRQSNFESRDNYRGPVWSKKSWLKLKKKLDLYPKIDHGATQPTNLRKIMTVSNAKFIKLGRNDQHIQGVCWKTL